MFDQNYLYSKYSSINKQTFAKNKIKQSFYKIIVNYKKILK